MPLLFRKPLSALWAAALACAVQAAGAQTSAVQRGEYLARAGDCISCHTAPGGAPYAGGYRLETPFGALLAPNITPDAATGIVRWSTPAMVAGLRALAR